MKKTLTALLLVFSALAFADAETKASDYTIKVHVSSAEILTPPNVIRIWVVIGGNKYELQGIAPGDALLALGDYNAKLVKDEHKTAYDSFQVYEFLFSDGKTRQYRLAGATE